MEKSCHVLRDQNIWRFHCDKKHIFINSDGETKVCPGCEGFDKLIDSSLYDMYDDSLNPSMIYINTMMELRWKCNTCKKDKFKTPFNMFDHCMKCHIPTFSKKSHKKRPLEKSKKGSSDSYSKIRKATSPKGEYCRYRDPDTGEYCFTRAKYGYSGGRKKRCCKHKKHGMELPHYSLCDHPSCYGKSIIEKPGPCKYHARFKKLKGT